MTASVVSTLVSAGIQALFVALSSYTVVLSFFFLFQDAYACYNEADDQILRILDAAQAPTKLTIQHDDKPVLSRDISDKPYCAPVTIPISTTDTPYDSTQWSLVHLHLMHCQRQISSRLELLSAELSMLNQTLAQAAAMRVVDLPASLAGLSSLQQTQALHSRASSTFVIHNLLEGTQRSHQDVAETEQQKERPSKIGFLDLPGGQYKGRASLESRLR